MAFAPMILGALGTVAQAGGAILAGQNAKAAADFEAEQLRRRANEERAAGTREAAERGRQANELMGDQIAAAAASGGGASDPSVLDIMGDTYAYGLVQRQNVYANAENQARIFEGQAEARKIEGKNAATAGVIGGIAGAASGLGNMYRQNSTSALLSGNSQGASVDRWRRMMPAYSGNYG